MNSKVSIGVVVAIVLQVSAFVWWTAQQAQTIEQLNSQVTELTSRMAVEEAVNMKRDIEQFRTDFANGAREVAKGFSDIEKRLDRYETQLEQMHQGDDIQAVRVINAKFDQFDEWLNEYDVLFDDLYAQIEKLEKEIQIRLAELDKKLSDRMKQLNK